MPKSHENPFDESRLLSQAQDRTGMDDFGGDGFRKPLGVLLEAYAGAGLNKIGETVLRTSVRRSLVQRLLTQDFRRRHPEIEEEVIRDPIVVVGMMRSGTTLIQRLLSRDPRFHCAYGWEIGEPAPRRGTPLGADDPRIADGIVRANQMRDFTPELYAIHPIDALEADEEIVFLADAFLSHVPEASCNVPAYRSWIDDQDFTPAYHYLKRMLQFLQWQKRGRGEVGRRWVLKTPAHLGYLDILFKVFPDAHVIHMHRDPLQTVPSGASLNYTLWKLYADDVDPDLVGEQWLERMIWANRRGLRFRDQISDESARFTDVSFHEAVAEPIVQTKRIYASLELSLGAETQGAMEEWLAQEARNELPAHRYTAERFGLTDDAILAGFGEYRSRFI